MGPNMHRILTAMVIIWFLLLSACSPISSVQSTKSDVWCVKGSAYAEQGISSRIAGIALFKGEEYCKASASLSANGESLDYTYYFNRDGTDVWVVVTQDGRTTETRLQR